MRISNYLLVVTFIGLSLQACSTESIKRTSYETLENIRLQDCHKDPSTDCTDREGYDEYRQKRESVIGAQP